MKKAVVCVFAIAAAFLTLAASPYRGLEGRDIKAVSPERIDALISGSGAGYALAAELNGYPGPRHVIDLAAALALSEGQRAQTQRLFDRMQAEAIPLGRALVAREAKLEAAFRSREITEKDLYALTAEIGRIDAQLRATHLKYHLSTARLLSAHQRAEYDRLRGYAGDRPQHSGKHGHGH